jgi:UDP-GlcNAc:undecaprenyl-phosphate/decaprenyl-phosphate GlcNAc-1-phosphate transferase
MNFSLLLPFFVALGVALIATPLSIRFAERLKLVDDPKKHIHPAIIHTKPIPRTGGLPIFLAVLFSTLIFLPLTPIYVAILIAGVFVVLVGLLDDKYDLSPYLRFLMNIVCALVVVAEGVTVPFVTSPLGGILHFSSITLSNIAVPVGSILAIIWIVWVMNMLNWSKGVDGQMPGIAAISAIIIGIASLRFPVLGPHNIEASIMAFIVAGGAIGFLFYNFYPAKIFPGYSATILGFTIGILSILSGVKLATAVLVMGVPAVDFLFTFTRRILSRKSPFRGDRQHLHHLLLAAGLSQRSIALFYWAMSLVLGILSLTLSSRGKLFAILLVGVLVVGFILTMRFLTRGQSND